MFTFRTQWKEDLVASGPLPDFVIGYVGQVYAPSRNTWIKRLRLPAELYSDFFADLAAWCAENGTALEVEDY